MPQYDAWGGLKKNRQAESLTYFARNSPRAHDPKACRLRTLAGIFSAARTSMRGTKGALRLVFKPDLFANCLGQTLEQPTMLIEDPDDFGHLRFNPRETLRGLTFKLRVQAIGLSQATDKRCLM